MHYKIGTMIEIPRAALLADEIASEAEFFSFGTNDLTQMTFGFQEMTLANSLTHIIRIRYMNQTHLHVLTKTVSDSL